MSVVKFRTVSVWSDKIEAVEVVSESAKMVVIRERAESGGWVDSKYQKRSAHFCLHESWEQARKYLIARLVSRQEHLSAESTDIDQRISKLQLLQPATLQ